MNHKGPILLDCHVIEDENCYPMVAPGKSNSQMIGIQKLSKKNTSFNLIKVNSPMSS
jgi:acetolactate synthase-1/2/3 large subunit